MAAAHGGCERAAHPLRHRSRLGGGAGFLSGELHKGENAGILIKLRTAIIRGLRPTTLILRKQPHSKWNDLDRLLLEAYQLFEDEISKNSGLPIWLTRSINPEIILGIEETEDVADRLLAEWDSKNASDEKKRGVSRRVVAFDADSNPLEYGGLTRQHFREERAQLGDREDGVTPGLEKEGDREYFVPPED